MSPASIAADFVAPDADLVDRIMKGLEANKVVISHCPSSFLPGQDVDALQFDGVELECAFEIEGRAFLYGGGDKTASPRLMEVLVKKGAMWCKARVDTRAMLDIAYDTGTDAGWELYRATLALVFPTTTQSERRSLPRR